MRKEAEKSGYSLVEVTLALLVVAIGMTATFALFPEGLRATRAAVSDTEVALFAEYVFTTLDLTTILKGADWKVADCKNFKSMALAGGREDNGTMLQETSGNKTAVFKWVFKDYGVPNSPEYPAQGADGWWTSAFTYQLEFFDWEDGSTYAKLTVWPGDYPTQGANELPENEKRIFTRAIQAIRGEALTL